MLRRRTDSVAIFIDESVRLVELLKDKKCLRRGEDAYHSARRLILGDEVAAVANTSLIMTALNVSPLGITDSGRPVVPLVLPGALDVNKIVDEIFAPRIELLKRSLSRGDEVVLFALARFVYRAPRLTQLMADSIESILADPAAQLTDSSTIDKLWALFEVERCRLYPNVTFPEGRHLHALLVGETSPIDEYFMDLVRSSSFTNSITLFPIFLFGGMGRDIPEAVLYLLATGAGPDSGTIEERIWILIREIMAEAKVALNENTGSEGGLLEKIFPKMFCARLKL
jgi:hypothetical protein